MKGPVGLMSKDKMGYKAKSKKKASVEEANFNNTLQEEIKKLNEMEKRNDEKLE